LRRSHNGFPDLCDDRAYMSATGNNVRILVGERTVAEFPALPAPLAAAGAAVRAIGCLLEEQDYSKQAHTEEVPHDRAGNTRTPHDFGEQRSARSPVPGVARLPSRARRAVATAPRRSARPRSGAAHLLTQEPAHA
jgi:hypothetical protein